MSRYVTRKTPLNWLVIDTEADKVVYKLTIGLEYNSGLGWGGMVDAESKARELAHSRNTDGKRKRNEQKARAGN